MTRIGDETGVGGLATALPPMTTRRQRIVACVLVTVGVAIIAVGDLVFSPGTRTDAGLGAGYDAWVVISVGARE